VGGETTEERGWGDGECEVVRCRKDLEVRDSGPVRSGLLEKVEKRSYF